MFAALATALRICRLCYLQCEQGKTKEEVLVFRSLQYQKCKNKGAKPLAELIEEVKKEVLNDTFEQEPAKLGNASPVGPPGQEDAPPGHISFAKVRYREQTKVYENTGQQFDSSLATFRLKSPDGTTVNFQTTLGRTGSKEQCLRIARLCWLEFEKGKSKEEVTVFRNAEYEKLEKQGIVASKGKEDVDKVGKKSSSSKSSATTKLPPEKKRKKANGLEGSGLQDLLKKVKDLGRLQGAVQLGGRNTAKQAASINGIYTSISGGLGGFPAYERFVQDGEDARNKRFLFYSSEQQRWKVRDALEDSKQCFAYCKVKKREDDCANRDPRWQGMECL